MANEATVQTSLQIRKGNLFYQSRPSSFQANVVGDNGPSPGCITVPVHGIAVVLTELDKPGGLCRIQNLDLANYVEYGAQDPHTGKFYPIGEALAGENFIVRLSRFIGSTQGTGTGSAPTPGSISLYFRAPDGACQVIVEAFDA
jgi:hypothetical protein